MISITVKTLTGSDYPFEVADDLTVRQFKEHISEAVHVPAERQRLIFQGRVLQDERTLSELSLDHRTVHLVERLPGIPGGSSGGSSPLFQRRSAASEGTARGQQQRGPPGEILQQQMVVGAVALPSGDLSRDQIAACLRRILNRIGEIGRRAELETRETADGTSVQVDIRLRSLTPNESPPDASPSGSGRRSLDGPATQRVDHIRHIIRHINHILYHLEHDEADSTSQESSAATAATLPSSVSVDRCDNCAHEAPTAESGTNREREPVDHAPPENSDGHHHREADSVDGEEVEIRQVRISGLASLLDEILRLEDRLRPHLARYQAILREDADYSGNEAEGRRASRIFNSVQTILHNLAHVYHTYSDLNVHFCQPPPRSLYPQLVGVRAQPTANPSGSQRTMSAVHTSAEVQITMNFQRGNTQDEANEQRQPSPQPPRPSSASGNVSPFPNIRVEGSDGRGAAYTTVDISPNAVTINQVTARIEPSTDRPHSAGPTGGTSQQQQQQIQVPANLFQQIMQGLAGATAGVVAGNFGLGPGGFAGRMQGYIQPHQRPQGPPIGGMRMPMPRQGFVGRPPLPPQGQYLFGGPVGGPRETRMMQPQNLIFTAAPYNIAPNATQPAVFVGYDPPAMLPLYTFDEYVPCASRHFDPRQRPSLFSRRPQGTSQAESASASASTSENAATGEAAEISERELEFERHLEPIVRSVVTSLQESIPGGGGGQQELWQFIPVFTGIPPGATGMRITPAGANQHLRPTMGDGNPMRRPSSDPNLARQAPPRHRTTSAAPGTGSASASSADDQAMIEEIVRGVYDGMMGRSGQAIGEHFRAMGHELEYSDSVLAEAMQTVVASLSFSDLWSLFANDSRPLDRSRPVLRRHFVETILNGNESPSEADIRSAAVRAAATDAHVWQELAVSIASTEDFDLAATMVQCEEAFLLDVMNLVFGYNFEPGDDFGRRLYDRLWLFAREAVTAALTCCADGERGLEEFATRLCENTTRHVSGEFRQMFVSSGMQHLRTLYTQHRLDRGAIERYLVRKSSSQADTSVTSVPEVPSTTSTDGAQASLSVGSASRTEDSDGESEYSTAPSHPEKKPESTKRADEEWKGHLPPEWVRVVETDVERQKNMPPPKPFSDAYLNGMPSKRRKLVLEQRPRSILNAAATSTDAFLKEVLRQAITEARVTPITGEQVDDVVEHISVDENGPELAESFSRNVEHRFGARLRQEQASKGDNEGKDFDPQRFPNATARFCKK